MNPPFLEPEVRLPHPNLLHPEVLLPFILGGVKSAREPHLSTVISVDPSSCSENADGLRSSGVLALFVAFLP